jgi:hypothetical protein
MITEFKLYESTLKDVEQLQLCKLAILKFTKQVSEVFYKTTPIPKFIDPERTRIFQQQARKLTKFVEEEKTYLSIANYKLKYNSETLLFISITLDKKIAIRLHTIGWKNYYQFMLYFLNDSERHVHNFTFTYDELNKMSDKIVDDYELYTNVNKYNI